MKGNKLIEHNEQIPDEWNEIDWAEFLVSYNGFRNKKEYIGSIFVENKKLKEENEKLVEENKKLKELVERFRKDLEWYE